MIFETGIIMAQISIDDKSLYLIIWALNSFSGIFEIVG